MRRKRLTPPTPGSEVLRRPGCFLSRAPKNTGRREYAPNAAWGVIALLLLLLATRASAADLRDYDTAYYTIHTDLDEDAVREAAVRLTRMAEAYHDRTRDFSGMIDHKFPFYLYRREADYLEAGGREGTAGVFVYRSGTREGVLMAVAGKHATADTWHTVQHEGFHQFAHAVIGGTLPPWLDEGLAEYFGEGIFTGDGFLTGAVPPWRLERLKSEINGDADAVKLQPIRQIMLLGADEWNSQMSLANYDQAWSMVYFLVHGDNGRYQHAFAACIRALASGQPFERAWLDTLGPADGFEKRWRAYWIGQPESPTKRLYQQAVVAILTSFLARAEAQGQTFKTFEDFRTAAAAKQLKMSDADWLPPALLDDAVEASRAMKGWELKTPPKKPVVLGLVTDDGQFTGTYVLKGGRVKSVNVVQAK